MLAGKKQQQGLTLIELLVVIVILIVVMGAGVPAYQKMQQRNELIADYNRLLAGLRQTRSEAIRRQESATFNTKMNADNTWSFTIHTSDSIGGELLAKHQSRVSQVKISEGTLVFDRMGRLKPGTEGCSLMEAGKCTFSLSLADFDRELTIVRTGRVKRGSNQ